MRIILIVLFIAVLLSCNHSNVEEKPKTNDTTEVLGLLIDSFLVKGHNYMGSLYRDSIFKDLIIMQYDSIYTKLLPQVEGVKFKILTEDEICNYATIHESDPKNWFPDIIKGIKFIKENDTTYIASLVIPSVTPYYDKYGKPYFDPEINELHNDTTVKCWYHLKCGYAYHTIEVFKRGDSLFINKKSLAR
jgi:hypothetical protein